MRISLSSVQFCTFRYSSLRLPFCFFPFLVHLVRTATVLQGVSSVTSDVSMRRSVVQRQPQLHRRALVLQLQSHPCPSPKVSYQNRNFLPSSAQDACMSLKLGFECADDVNHLKKFGCHVVFCCMVDEKLIMLATFMLCWLSGIRTGDMQRRHGRKTFSPVAPSGGVAISPTIVHEAICPAVSGFASSGNQKVSTCSSWMSCRRSV